MQDDKKKLIVLGVLGVLVLAIGAFQMRPVDEPKPAAAQASGWKPPVEETPVGEKAEPPRNPMVVAALPRRDPFDVPDYAKPKVPGTDEPVNQVEVPMPKFQEPKRRPRSMGGRLTGGEMRGSFGGPLPPAEIEIESESPNPTQANPSATAPVTVPQAEIPKPPEPTFDYTLSGVIVGRRPAAVLRDKQGGQRLVTVGGMIDGDSTLIEVRQGAAIVDVRGKRMRIELNGDPDAK